MELNYGIKQPLRIYEDPAHRVSQDKNFAQRHFAFLYPVDKIPPFQIERTAGLSPITSIQIVDEEGTKTEIINDLGADQLSVFPFTTFDRLIHYGDATHSAGFAEGVYYLEITDGVNTWYSEDIDFKSIPETLGDCAYTKIVFWDTCDVGDIFYRTLDQDGKQYKNIVYLDLKVGRPQYEIGEEGEEDSRKKFIPESLKMSKLYSIEGLFPEYFIDALYMLPLHTAESSVIEILTDKGYTGVVEHLEMPSVEWQDTFALWGKQEIIFSTASSLKLNCCGEGVGGVEAPLSMCVRDALQYVAEVEQGSADYLNYEYTPATGGITKIPFVNNDLLMIKFVSGVRQIVRYTENPDMYNPQLLTLVNGDAGHDLNLATNLPFDDPNSFFWNGNFLKKPTIDTLSQHPTTLIYTVSGKTYKNCTVTVTAFTGGGNSQIVAIGSGEDYIGPGLEFTAPPNTQSIRISCKGLNCDLGTSEYFNILISNPVGIGVMIVEGDFIVT